MNEAFGRALRDLARPTTPEDLQRRGVRRVRSVSVEQVSRMIQIAIDQTLDAHRAQLEEGERAELARGAEERLRTLVETQQHLAHAVATQREARDEAPLPSLADSSAAADLDELRRLLEREPPDARALGELAETALERAREREELLRRRLAKLARTAEDGAAALDAALACFESRHSYRSHAPLGVDRRDPRREQKLRILRGVLDTNRGFRRT